MVCLPSHTTHALQPCDVGVFGPLAIAWKVLVLKTSRDLISIRKENLLAYYHEARQQAFQRSTIISAFAKTGIHPWNPDVHDFSIYEPSLNTTTQAAQPIPAQLPSTLIEINEPLISAIPHITISPDTSTETPSPLAVTNTPLSTSTSQTVASGSVDRVSSRYVVRNMPDPLSTTASQSKLVEQNTQLQAIIADMKSDLERGYAQTKLMDRENECLCNLLFGRSKARVPGQYDTTHARHMTSEENQRILAARDWESNMKKVFAEARTTFDARQKLISDFMKALAAEKKAAEQVEKKKEKEHERAEKKAEIQAQKAAEKEAKRKHAEETRQQKAAEKQALGKIGKKAEKKEGKQSKKVEEIIDHDTSEALDVEIAIEADIIANPAPESDAGHMLATVIEDLSQLNIRRNPRRTGRR